MQALTQPQLLAEIDDGLVQFGDDLARLDVVMLSRDDSRHVGEIEFDPRSISESPMMVAPVLRNILNGLRGTLFDFCQSFQHCAITDHST